jgi:hypothetical protein
MLGLFMAELGVGYYDAAIGAANDALDAGYRIYLVHAFLGALMRSKAIWPRRRLRWPSLAA